VRRGGEHLEVNWQSVG